MFWRTYLPIYRADYTLIGKYDFDKLDIVVDIPTTVFYSEMDTPLREVKEWERFFSCEFYEFSGSHFFISKHHKEMGKIIKIKMGV